MKTCRRCGKTKPLSEFYKQSRNRRDGRKVDGSRGGQGVLALCKPCWKDYTYEGTAQRRYGLSAGVVRAMREGPCAICGTTDVRRVIDHDHRNGKVRAALCDPCNRGLGDFHDDPDRMRAAAAYIEDWRASHG